MLRSQLSGSNNILTAVIAVLVIQLRDCWSGVSAITLAPVYWNLTNPIFKTSKNDHIIVVNLYDEIDFVCPHHPPTITDSNLLEYYLIYRVSKKEYDDCNIYSENATFLILRCTHPRQKRRFTILFEPFQSIPNVPEYKAGHTYYFMTPSTGRKSGLRNLYQGACLHHNMKLTIKVRDGDYEGLLGEEFPHSGTENETLVVAPTEVHRRIQLNDDKEHSQGFRKAVSPSATGAETRRPHLGHPPRPATTPRSAGPWSHRQSTPKAALKHRDRADKHRPGLHSSSDEPDSDVEDPENLEAFLKSRKEQPSVGQTNNTPSPKQRTIYFVILATQIVGILVARLFGRWSHV